MKGAHVGLVDLCALVSLLGLTGLLYVPGLFSGFFLDDYYNLHELSRISKEGYATFIFSGVAGALGRPLSLLSFALQHDAWPQDPFAFKAVNLFIHLLNGILVFLISRFLAALLRWEDRTIRIFSFSVAALWLLHPIQQTTVIYVVQRMTELSALFVLLGMYGYLLGRRGCTRGRLAGGYAGMSLAIVVGTLLAMLSKENGVLLPLLVLIVDLSLLRAWPAPPGYASWRRLFLVLPSAAIGLYLLYTLPEAVRGFEFRSYSIWEKFITETVVLAHYLVNLLLPSPGAFGLYHDDFPISSGLLKPAYTMAAVIGVAGLIAAALAARRTHPVFAFGMLWFFAGHLLESTHLNLVIYFEHRNYLPSLGIFFVLAWAAVRLSARVSIRGAVVPAAIIYAGLTLWVSAQGAVLWRDPLLQASEAVRSRPGSVWARVVLGSRYIAAGRADQAVELYRQMEREFPRAIYPRLKQMAVRGCVQDAAMDDAWWRETLDLVPRAELGSFEVIGELDTVISTLIQGECLGIDVPELIALMESLAENPDFLRQRGALFELAANLSLHAGERERALGDLTRAAKASPNLGRRLRLIELQLATGKLGAARSGLDRLETLLKRHPLAAFSYRDRVRALRENLRARQTSQPTDG